MQEAVSLALDLSVASVAIWYVSGQCRKPNGWLGRLMVGMMNGSHFDLTTWGLQHTKVGQSDTILDIGCGGGRTIQRLAEMAAAGKVKGVDYSAASVASARSLNKAAIKNGRVEIEQASVSRLPFADNSFDLVTAVETHYYWPDHHQDLLEIQRVLKPGGLVLIIAEAFRGQRFGFVNQAAMKLIGGGCLSPDEHRDLLVNAGYEDSQVFVEQKKGWLCATGRKPLP